MTQQTNESFFAVPWVRVMLSCVFVLGLNGCGLVNEDSASTPRKRSVPIASILADALPTGDWLEVECHEGDVGPDLPPPSYSKGVIRFANAQMKWGSRIYDDNGCTVARPQSVPDNVIQYRIPERPETTDGSIPLDVQVPYIDSPETYTMYALLKVSEGKLYFALFPTAQSRPKSLELERAQVFAPMPAAIASQ
jgi:hypothetical protein